MLGIGKVKSDLTTSVSTFKILFR